MSNSLALTIKNMPKSTEINSAVSLFYYMRIVKMMYLTHAPDETKLHIRPAYLGLVSILAIPIIGLGFYWAPLRHVVQNSMILYQASSR